MHNKPHTAEAKAKMSAARKAQPVKWGNLPEDEIITRLLQTDATTRSIAAEYGCCDSVIKKIFRKHTTVEQRLTANYRFLPQARTPHFRWCMVARTQSRAGYWNLKW